MGKFLLFACLSIFAATAPAPAAEVWRTLPDLPPMPQADSNGHANVNDIRMYYAIYGGGDANRETVILLHGGLSHSDIWGYQIPALTAAGHRVVVADSRGHGRSTRSAQPFGYALMATDVAALMDALKISSAAFIGWSDGGIIALDLAMHHAGRVSKIIAFGANTSVSGTRDDAGTSEVFNQYISSMADDFGRLSPTPAEYDVFVAQVSAMWASQPNYTPAQLATIQIPVLIADGEYDEAIRQEHNPEMARLIPGATLQILPGVSHFAFLQEPDEFNAAVLAFLRK